MRPLPLIAVLLLATPCALAQVAAKPAKACIDPLVQTPSSGQSKDGSGAASIDQDICSVSPEGQAAPSTASSVVAATLAEAHRRTANLKFEVGPPPRNLTKGADVASRPIS
jgi:hypothetical protein